MCRLATVRPCSVSQPHARASRAVFVCIETCAEWSCTVLSVRFCRHVVVLVRRYVQVGRRAVNPMAGTWRTTDGRRSMMDGIDWIHYIFFFSHKIVHDYVAFTRSRARSDRLTIRIFDSNIVRAIRTRSVQSIWMRCTKFYFKHLDCYFTYLALVLWCCFLLNWEWSRVSWNLTGATHSAIFAVAAEAAYHCSAQSDSVCPIGPLHRRHRFDWLWMEFSAGHLRQWAMNLTNRGWKGKKIFEWKYHAQTMSRRVDCIWNTHSTHFIHTNCVWECVLCSRTYIRCTCHWIALKQHWHINAEP